MLAKSLFMILALCMTRSARTAPFTSNYGSSVPVLLCDTASCCIEPSSKMSNMSQPNMPTASLHTVNLIVNFPCTQLMLLIGESAHDERQEETTDGGPEDSHIEQHSEGDEEASLEDGRKEDEVDDGEAAAVHHNTDAPECAAPVDHPDGDDNADETESRAQPEEEEGDAELAGEVQVGIEGGETETAALEQAEVEDEGEDPNLEHSEEAAHLHTTSDNPHNDGQSAEGPYEDVEGSEHGEGIDDQVEVFDEEDEYASESSTEDHNPEYHEEEDEDARDDVESEEASEEYDVEEHEETPLEGERSFRPNDAANDGEQHDADNGLTSLLTNLNQPG